MTEFSTTGVLTAESLQEGIDLLRKRSEEQCCEWQHPLVFSPDTPPEVVYQIVRSGTDGTAAEVDEIAWRAEHAWRERQEQDRTRLLEMPPLDPSGFEGIDWSIA